MKSLKICIPIIMAIAMLSACSNTRQLQILQGSFDTAKLSSYNLPKTVIQKGDLLNIIVYSDNPQATAIYNQPIAAQSANPSAATGSPEATVSQPSGYLVDENGDINFQGLGKLHIEGLTKAELSALLDQKLKDVLQNAYYNIRFLNYKVTVIGDVVKPGLYTIPSEKVTILEALGLAGDLNVSGRRDNILVIRETAGKREFGRLDLTKPDVFSSQYYFLQQNDVVVVDVSKFKSTPGDEKTLRTITIAASVLSTIAIFLNVFR